MKDYGKAVGKGAASGVGKWVTIAILTALFGGGITTAAVVGSSDDDDDRPSTSQVQEEED